MRNVKTRKGFEYWDKICSLKHYGFLHSPDGKRVVKTEGIGNWIDKFEAQEIVDQAQDEVNQYRAERDVLQQRLTAANERNDLAIDMLRRARAVVEGGGWTDLERDIAKFLKPCKPAAQPQGEPVARQPDAIIEGVMTSVGITHAIYASTVSLKHGEQVKLYAEQPAPVVSVPERLVMTDGLHSFEYVTGHNDAIGKMLGVKP